MATSKKFSELPAASSVGNGDLFAIAHEDAQAETGYVSQKLTAAQAGQKVNGDTEYPTSLPSFPENGQNPFAALEKLNQDIIDLYPVSTASGSIANFSTSLALPLVECKAQIVAQQAGSGTPSPQNERAISGFSEVNVTRCGINIWNELTELGNIDNATGEDASSNNILRTKGYIDVKPNTSYYFKAPTETGRNLTVFFYDENKNFISLAYKQNNTGTTPQNAHYMRFKIASAYGTTYNNDISINYPSTDTQYHAYKGNIYLVEFGQTIYGGRLIYSNGQWAIEATHQRFPLASLTWYYDSVNSRLYATVPNRTRAYGARLTPFLCTCYLPITDGRPLAQVPDLSCYMGGANDPTIYVHDSNYTDPTIFDNSLGANTICYPLQTPTIIPITSSTSQDIPTLLGKNNIFSDCGDVEVSFKQDIQEYIDAKIAETQALIL